MFDLIWTSVTGSELSGICLDWENCKRKVKPSDLAGNWVWVYNDSRQFAGCSQQIEAGLFLDLVILLGWQVQ